MSIAEFLLARIAEDYDWLTCPGCGASESRCQRAREDNAIKCCPDCSHPARATAEQTAKRLIVAGHEMTTVRPAGPEGWWWDAYCDHCTMGGDYTDITKTPSEVPCLTLRILAAVYADHPDYRNEWRPDA